MHATRQRLGSFRQETVAHGSREEEPADTSLAIDHPLDRRQHFGGTLELVDGDQTAPGQRGVGAGPDLGESRSVIEIHDPATELGRDATQEGGLAGAESQHHQGAVFHSCQRLLAEPQPSRIGARSVSASEGPPIDRLGGDESGRPQVRDRRRAVAELSQQRVGVIAGQ